MRVGPGVSCPRARPSRNCCGVSQCKCRHFAPDEPQPLHTGIRHLERTAYRGKLWATRQRVWVERVASAWLIRRFIDPNARFLWLKTPQDCPADAIGFDFDGAAFTHTGQRVTFEAFVASFDLG